MMTPNPTKEPNTEHPMFEPIWQAIKAWDIERTPGEGYAHATGTDVQAILDALDSGAVTGAGANTKLNESKHSIPTNNDSPEELALGLRQSSVRSETTSVTVPRPLREALKDAVEVLLKDYLRDNLDNWHTTPTPERIEEYLRFHMPGYTREEFAKLFDAYVLEVRK